MQVTSYLMMGALSPGLKRHSVTLFEGDFCQCPVPLPACLQQQSSHHFLLIDPLT